jgi:hypothetical protein
MQTIVTDIDTSGEHSGRSSPTEKKKLGDYFVQISSVDEVLETNQGETQHADLNKGGICVSYNAGLLMTIQSKESVKNYGR